MRRPLLISIVAVTIVYGCACRRATAPSVREVHFLVWTNPAPFIRNVIRHFNATVPGVNVLVQTTAGSVFVVSALQRDAGDLGFAQADVVYNAYRRGFEDEPFPHTNLAGIAVLWVNTVFVVVPQGSSLQSVADLRGKRVGVGPQGSSAELFARIVLDGFHLTYADVHPQFEAVDSMTTSINSGALDAAVLVTSRLPESLAHGADKFNGRLLPITREVLRQLRSRYAFIKPGNVPAGTVGDQPDDVPTAGVDGLLVCRKDLPEELVYQLTKQFFAVMPHLGKSDPTAAVIDVEKAPATPIPLHPGAARFYREREILE